MLEVLRKTYPIPTEEWDQSVPDLQSISEVLLGINSKRQPHFLILAGIGAYFLLLFVSVTVDFSPEPVTLESPMEMVYEDPPAPEEKQPEPPPPEPEKPPEPEPVAEVPPEKPPEPEPKKEPEKPKPKPRPSVPHIAGAIPSDYANKVFQRINRIASDSFPRTALTKQTVRIGYVIVIGASGELISKAVSSSGVPALDQAVSQALARSAPFPAPPNLGARSYKISGAIVYRVQ
jgi:periplasmic protein TonB